MPVRMEDIKTGRITVVGKFNGRMQKLTGDDCLNLQFASIMEDQARREPQFTVRCNIGKELMRGLDKQKRKSFVSFFHKRYYPKAGTFCVLDPRLTTKGAKALTACGGTVFISPRKRAR